ncbi:MAG: hypothetical protein INR62_04925 [Rhodospirillales bacterium]|nr:hypothetical protein [Acetobacter sp.]
MRKLFLSAAALAVCAGPAFAQAGRLAQDCYLDPEATGSLRADPHSLYLPGERPLVADPDPPEESWQAEARENLEQRRQDLLECGAD